MAWLEKASAQGWVPEWPTFLSPWPNEASVVVTRPKPIGPELLLTDGDQETLVRALQLAGRAGSDLAFYEECNRLSALLTK